MTDWKQIAIDLYRDGMPRHLIREKLELTATELASYLIGEPAPARNGKPSRKISEAKRVGVDLLAKGVDVNTVHKRLQRLGLKATVSTVRTWRWHVQGPTNKKIDPVIIAEILDGEPGASARDVAAVYAMRTGDKVSHQSIDYWIRKMKKSKEAA